MYVTSSEGRNKLLGQLLGRKLFNSVNKDSIGNEFYVNQDNLSQIKIDVFNILGKHVELLFHGMQNPGIYKVQWDGNKYSSGLYLIRMSSNNYNFTEKIMLVK